MNWVLAGNVLASAVLEHMAHGSIRRSGSWHSQFRHESISSRRWLQTGHASGPTASSVLAAHAMQILAGPVSR